MQAFKLGPGQRKMRQHVSAYIGWRMSGGPLIFTPRLAATTPKLRRNVSLAQRLRQKPPVRVRAPGDRKDHFSFGGHCQERAQVPAKPTSQSVPRLGNGRCPPPQQNERTTATRRSGAGC